jgi:two-component system NarL family sensor kinase
MPDIASSGESNNLAGMDPGCAVRVKRRKPRPSASDGAPSASAELRRLSGELLRTQDRERRRIARDLHDSTAQLLYAIAMNMAILRRMSLPTGRAKKLIDSSQALARQCSNEIRAISYLLHPPLLDELGLTVALEKYAAGFRERTAIELHLDISPDLGRLGMDAETTLFRIVQESLSNVHRHSGARHVVISLGRIGREVVLEIADDGRGFPGPALAAGDGNLAKLGVGILGMRERARQLGGKLEIESGAGGARIRASLAVEELNGEHSCADRG